MNTPGNPTGLFLLMAVLLLFQSCDLLKPDRPDEARVFLQGNTTSEVQLITSSRYLSQRISRLDQVTGTVVNDSLKVVFLDADTSIVRLPYEGRYDISSTEQFYAEIKRFDPEADGLYSRIWIDRNLRMDKMPAPEENIIVFAYDFRIITGKDPDAIF